jgi:hypothetical protein
VGCVHIHSTCASKLQDERTKFDLHASHGSAMISSEKNQRRMRHGNMQQTDLRESWPYAACPFQAHIAVVNSACPSLGVHLRVHKRIRDHRLWLTRCDVVTILSGSNMGP